MIRDVAAPGPLWERLKHLWKPPEWERAGHAPVHTWETKILGATVAPEGAPTDPRPSAPR